ncbi:hypothetical protein HDV06_004825 [Boothiomyces sp. JEL0866]|nr:hypothetical protein HDV06_004825 [Boothiomyces sp. JEL0866]
MADCQLFYQAFQQLGGNYPGLTGTNCCKFDTKMVQCDSQNNIIQINLSNMNTAGANLPPTLGNLKSLRDLQMANCKLSGSIPTTFVQPIWSHLDLSNNNLTGTIPELQTLNAPRVYFDFRNNDFVGQIPANLTRPGLLVDSSSNPDQCPFDSFMCPYKNVKPFGCNSTVFTCSIKGGTSNSSSALSTGLIAAIGIGAAVLLIGVVVGAVWFFKRGDAKVGDIKPRSVPTMYHTEISNRPIPPEYLQSQQPPMPSPAPTLHSSFKHSPSPSFNMPQSHSPVAQYGQLSLPDNSTMPAPYSAYSDGHVRSATGNSVYSAQITPGSQQTTPISHLPSAYSAHTPSVHSGVAPGSIYSAHQYAPAYMQPPIAQTPTSNISYKAPSTHSQTVHTPIAAPASTVYNPDDELNESVHHSASIIQKDQSPKYIDLDQQLPYQKPETIQTQTYQTPDGKVYTYETKKSPLEYVSKEITNRSSAMQFANQLPLPVAKAQPVPVQATNPYNPSYYNSSHNYQFTYVDPSQIQAYAPASQVDPSIGYTFVDPSQLYYVDQDQVQYQDAEHS